MKHCHNPLSHPKTSKIIAAKLGLTKGIHLCVLGIELLQIKLGPSHLSWYCPELAGKAATTMNAMVLAEAKEDRERRMTRRGDVRFRERPIFDSRNLGGVYL